MGNLQGRTNLTGGGAFLRWLSGGSRDLVWALDAVPSQPDASSSPPPDWSPERHARHLALFDQHRTLPDVERALGIEAGESASALLEFERLNAAWDGQLHAAEIAADAVRSLGETRFALLQCLETAPDEAWAKEGKALRVSWLLARSYQHELDHLSAIWRYAVDRSSLDSPTSPSRPHLHAADRVESR